MAGDHRGDEVVGGDKALGAAIVFVLLLVVILTCLFPADARLDRWAQRRHGNRWWWVRRWAQFRAIFLFFLGGKMDLPPEDDDEELGLLPPATP